MNNPKFYLCPMSKNIVDSVLEINSEMFGLIATRRQIDFNGGYVNNWTTETFTNYVKNKKNLIIMRDHGGPEQGKISDDGIESLVEDSKYLDIIHIDPWKKYNCDFESGIDKTIELIKFCYNLNNKLKFEILTEEAIVKFEKKDLEFFLERCKTKLTPSEFDSIQYVVIQSGVGLDLQNQKNIGVFNKKRLETMIEVCKNYGKKTKEHNGDYLTSDDLKLRFDVGLDSINIGPELVQIETLEYLKYMSEEQITKFYEICLKSKKWKRWVSEDFDLNNEKELIKVCGHYCFDLFELPKVQDEIKKTIKNKLKIYLDV